MRNHTNDFEEMIETEVVVMQNDPDSPERVKALNEKMAIAHRGFQGLWEAVEALQDICDQRLYLCIKDAQGNPRYRTFEDFLKSEFNYTRSNYCRLRKAHETYQHLEEKYGRSEKELICALPKSISVFYEISKFPARRQDEIMEALKADVSSGTPITREHISQLRKRTQPLDIITVTSKTVDEDGANTSAENTSVTNDINESIESHDTETNGKTKTEKLIVKKEDTTVLTDSEEANLDDVLPADDCEDDGTDEENDYEKVRQKYDTLCKLMRDHEIHNYIANSSSVYEDFRYLCHDISDSINSIAAELESLRE